MTNTKSEGWTSVGESWRMMVRERKPCATIVLSTSRPTWTMDLDWDRAVEPLAVDAFRTSGDVEPVSRV